MKKWPFFLLPFALILFFLPQIASTQLGKPLFKKGLEAKTHAEIQEIGSLHLSWLGPQIFQDIHWSREKATGYVEELIIKAPFWSFSGPFQLKNGSVDYPGGKIEQIQGQVEGNALTFTATPSQGLLSLRGNVYSESHFDLQIDIEKFPSVAIEPQFAPLLGPLIDIKGEVRFAKGEGIMQLALDAENLKTTFHGYLKKGAITLLEPLIASFKITPELSALFLKDANPLFLTGFASKSPAFLKVEPTDFYLPYPFHLQAFKVGRATLDLGQIKCQNGKSLATLLFLLKTQPFSNAQQMDAWFTPISLRIEKGIVHTDRMDALFAGGIHVCTWGNIDVLKDQVQMNLGLPADTLKRYFDLKNLPATYVLKIPITGTTKDPEISTGVAAAQISALIAGAQISKKGVLGSLSELFSHPKEEKDIPPAKRPFPWES